MTTSMKRAVTSCIRRLMRLYAITPVLIEQDARIRCRNLLRQQSSTTRVKARGRLSDHAVLYALNSRLDHAHEFGYLHNLRVREVRV